MSEEKLDIKLVFTDEHKPAPVVIPKIKHPVQVTLPEPLPTGATISDVVIGAES